MIKYLSNNRYVPIFCVIFTTLVFLFGSCQKENSFSIQEHIKTPLKEAKVFPERPLMQQVVVQENANSFEVNFMLRSNDQEALEAISKEGAISFSAKPQIDLITLSTPVNQTTTTGPTELKENRSIVSIEMMSIVTSTAIQQLPSYSISLSQELQDFLKEKNIATLFLFSDKIKIYNNDSATAKSRNSEPYIEVWNNNKIVKIQGDGGEVKSSTDNWWAEYGDGENIHYLNSSRFFSTDYTSTCCMQSAISDAWVRGILVTHDVVSRVSGVANCCAEINDCYDDLEDIGPGCQEPSCTDNSFSQIEAKNMAFFMATEMQYTGKDLVSMFIKHQKALSKIIYSNESRYQSSQSKFDELWLTLHPLIKKNFSGNNTQVFSSKQIELGVQFLEELEKVTESDELTRNIIKIKQHLPFLKNKPLKEGLIAFDKLELALQLHNE